MWLSVKVEDGKKKVLDSSTTPMLAQCSKSNHEVFLSISNWQRSKKHIVTRCSKKKNSQQTKQAACHHCHPLLLEEFIANLDLKTIDVIPLEFIDNDDLFNDMATTVQMNSTVVKRNEKKRQEFTFLEHTSCDA